MPVKTKTHYFPLKDGLQLAIEFSMEPGVPVEWRENNGAPRVPIFARYFLADEFENAILDPSANSFLTGDEVLFVAEVYSKLVSEDHPCPDRSFHDYYVTYWKISRRLPEIVYAAMRGKNNGEAMKILLNQVVKMFDV